nr:endonuclease/exonuclease/phosphatase [Tanacetum cinerariifolium]
MRFLAYRKRVNVSLCVQQKSLIRSLKINNNDMGMRQPRLERRCSVSDRMVVRNSSTAMIRILATTGLKIFVKMENSVVGAPCGVMDQIGFCVW